MKNTGILLPTTQSRNSMDKLDQFKKERQRLNDLVSKYAKTGMKKFLYLDHSTFEAGTLDKRTKEMLGLVSSLVLRCDDCILYHLDQCLQLGITPDEILEVFEVGLLVGGSITIPHIRRSIDVLDQSIRQK